MTDSSNSRIPTLDGWRGIAIGMVLLAHLQRAYLHRYLFGQRWLDVGQHGVTVFFVLSGYLITSGLISKDRIDLRSFYIRRFFRIAPPALAYLFFLVLLTAFTPMKAIGNDLWRCVLSVRNYLPESPGNTCTEHFWSLSVEEQFYFVWPAILVLWGRRRGAFVAAIGAAAIAVFRTAHWSYYSADFRFLHTEVRADALLVGCLLAVALQHDSIRAMFTKHGRWLFAGAFVISASAIYHYDNLPPLHESVAIAIMIGATALNPNILPSRLLEMEHLKTTGLMSYGIYLWQGIFFRDTWGFIGPLLLIAAVFASWFLIERPAIAMGRRIASRSPQLISTPI